MIVCAGRRGVKAEKIAKIDRNPVVPTRRRGGHRRVLGSVSITDDAGRAGALVGPGVGEPEWLNEYSNNIYAKNISGPSRLCNFRVKHFAAVRNKQCCSAGSEILIVWKLDMSIRARIILLVAITFLATVSIGGYSIFQSRANALEVRGVTEGGVQGALAAADLVSALKDVQLLTQAMVSAPDVTLATQLNDKLGAQKTALEAAFTQQKSLAAGDAQRGLVEQAEASLREYLAAIADTAQFKLAGQKEMAEGMLFANVAQYQREMEEVIGTLRIEKNRSKDEAISTLNQNLASTVSAMTGVTLLALCVLGGLGWLLYRRVVLPIDRMQSKMTEIAESHDYSSRLPVESSDEIGRSIMAFNSMIGEIQKSSSLLRQKTNDIQTMLQNMPQGILTVGEGNVVHPEYSAHLETIFETSDIAGRDLLDLVFSHSNLGADLLSQVAAVAAACIGEDVMNFDFNEHLMVGEVDKTMPDGRVKILDINWSPITDDAGTTVRLLLCVRDVTELRKLAAEAGEQKRELEMIGEILAVTQEKFHEFISGSIKFIDENELIIREHATHDAKAIAQLFRNMHTIKGNARTYGLHHLTNVVHETEQSYEELRKTRPGIVWDQAELLDELDRVRTAIEHYSKINEVSLGRKGAGRRGAVDRYLMVDREQIQETLHRLETVNTGNLHELIAARDAVRKVLRLLGTEPVSLTLAGVFDSLPSLAKELGKLPPMVEIDDGACFVRNQVAATLKNVFMHLVRNSMDHGMEKPEERLAGGKPAAGTIRLKVAMANDVVSLGLSDDGRGLGLARIRTLAAEKGLVDADQAMSDEEVAALIFRPGFSTAAAVTEVSGRGVGMDAVLNFIKREHGSIEIIFTDDAIGAPFRRFETVVRLPAGLFVQVDEAALQKLDGISGDAPVVGIGDLAPEKRLHAS